MGPRNNASDWGRQGNVPAAYGRFLPVWMPAAAAAVATPTSIGSASSGVGASPACTANAWKRNTVQNMPELLALRTDAAANEATVGLSARRSTSGEPEGTVWARCKPKTPRKSVSSHGTSMIATSANKERADSQKTSRTASAFSIGLTRVRLAARPSSPPSHRRSAHTTETGRSVLVHANEDMRLRNVRETVGLRLSLPRGIARASHSLSREGAAAFVAPLTEKNW